jgi:hypothetical protein
MSEFVSSDVVVIGGGLAGICAALAAARQGAAVSLINNRPVLGGNSSSEIRVWALGATGGGSLYSEEMGILGELKLRNLYTNPESNVLLWDEVLLDAILAEKNIQLFLNTHILGIKCSDDHIVESVQGFQLASEREFVFTGKYFIDATGDGTIGAKAGVPFVMGQESRTTYDEANAPESFSPHTLGSTIFFISKKNGKPVRFIPPGYIHSIETVERFISCGGRVVNEAVNGCDYWWFEYGGAVNTITDSQEISIELKRIALGVWNYIKNSGRYNAANLTLEWIGSIPGKRESRRFKGAYVLRQEDVIKNVSFDDTIAYGGWYLDFHPAEGVFSHEQDCIQIPVRVYNIPFRCLFNREFPNLLFAGRNFSVSHAVFASSRIMNTCALTGEAAGTGAAYAIHYNCPPSKFNQDNIYEIQQTLLDHGGFIPGLHKNTKTNLAANARISASSALQELNVTRADAGDLALEQPWYLLVTKKSGVSFCDVMTKSISHKHTAVRLAAQELPSRLAADPLFETVYLDINPGTGWTRINFPLSFIEYEGFVLISGDAVEGASIITESIQTTGFLAGLKSSKDHKYPRIRTDIQGLYGCKNLNDGMIRPYKIPGSWISGEEEAPSVLFEWDSQVTVKKIVVYGNPDLCRELVSCITSDETRRSWRQCMPPELIKNYRVEICNAGRWSAAGNVTDNWKYRSVFCFPPGTSCNSMRVVFESTYGSPRAEVFEIEIF